MIYHKQDHCSDLIQDVLKGIINQETNCRSQVIYEAVGTVPSGNLKIINNSDCAMEITVKRKDNHEDVRFLVLPFKERIITVTYIKKIELLAIGSNQVTCKGKFCLEIYYKLPCSYKKHTHSCRSYDETCS